MNSQPTDALLARFGGDEFVMALPHTGKEAAIILAEQIHQGVV